MKICLTLLSVALWFVLTTCALNSSKKKNDDLGILANPGKLDSCMLCAVDSFFVRPSKPNVTGLTIDAPVAIPFFNRINLIDKYQVDNYDTLMKIFKMKNSGDRNIIYALTEQRYVFEKEIVTKLKAYSIPLIDTIKQNKAIIFLSNNISYSVDISSYQDSDGVLMFKPGKAPIFWTLKNEEKYCSELFVLIHQYYRCP